MESGMLMVRGETWACAGFPGDAGASGGSLFSLELDRAVNVILMLVLGNRNVHLEGSGRCQHRLRTRRRRALPRSPSRRPPTRGAAR